MANDPTPTDAPAEDVTDTAEAPDEELGDAGKAALQAERRARRDAERAAKSLEAELATLREQTMTEQEKAIATARAEAKAEALAEANARILRAEVRSAASSRLADPEDALRFLDLSGIAVDDEGNVDSKALATALDELVAAKPYLSNTAAQRVGGDADAGARGTAPASVDMNQLIRRAAGR